MNPAIVLMNNQMIMDMQRRGGGYNGKPPKGSWIIPVVIFILCLLFMWWAENGFAGDFGKNNCGDPCFAGGCPPCWKDECKEATKRFEAYHEISKGTPSWAELFLVQAAFEKCQPPKNDQ